jgi:hypothetical protein
MLDLPTRSLRDLKICINLNQADLGFFKDIYQIENLQSLKVFLQASEITQTDIDISNEGK